MVGDHLDDSYRLQRFAAALWDLVADAEAQLEGALLVELETERRRIDAFPNFAWPDPFTERFRDARP